MRNTGSIAAIASATLALMASTAGNVHTQEQPDTFRMDRIIVTATRTPLPLSAVPASVTVIDREELELRGARFLDDALRDVAGVSIAQTGSRGGVSAIFLRGGEPDYVQVLIDGVQINDPGGAVSIGNIVTADVERIEIVRGPVSVLYGSDAAAGVINIVTRSGSRRTRVHAHLSGGRGERVGDQATGSYGVVDWSAGASGGASALQFAATASGSRSSGAYAFNNEYENRTLSGKMQYAGTRADATFSARHVDRTFHYPTNGAGAVVDPNQFSAGELRTLGLDAGVRLGRRAELRATVGAHRADDGEDNPRDEPADDLSVFRSTVERRSADLRLNLHMPRATLLTVGAEREWQTGRNSLHSESSFGPYDSSTDEERDNTGWYAQLLAEPIAHTSLTLGARIDENDRFGTFETVRAGIASRFGPLRLHGAVGTGFKEPTFYENFATGFVRGDPSLQPEESRSVEAGGELVQGGLRIAATVFDQRFRNLIQYTGAPAEGAPNYHNVGAATARGAEFSASARLHERVRSSLAYTWLRTEVTDAGFAEDPLFQPGERLIRRPKHEISVHVAVNIDAATRGSLSLRHVGARHDLDFTDPAQWQGLRVELPAYRTADLSLERDLLSGGYEATAFVHVENVLDERYAPVFNFPANGRLFRVGLRAAFVQ